MKPTDLPTRNFPTAKEECRNLPPHPEYDGPGSAYELAFKDESFLLRQDMTTNGATYLGRTADVGRVAPGLRADLIAFAAPLDAAKPALPEVAWTMKAGRAWDRTKILNAWKGQVGLR